jgi:hypothetical protein
MSGVFSSPKQKLPAQQPEPEPIETVTEDATEAGRRRKKKLVAGGAQSTRISGIQSAVSAALKKRLGE